MNEKHQQLIADYTAGDASADDVLAACRENPEVLKQLAQHTAMERLIACQTIHDTDATFTEELLLRLKEEQDSSFSDDVISQIKSKKKSLIAFYIPLAAAACLIISLTLYFNFNNSSSSLAKLTASVDAVWKNQIRHIGDSIGKGTLKLSQGYSEITMSNGVSLLLEAPVELQIESTNLVRLLKGNMVANVNEEAIGFTVLTPNSEIVDLGTEFAMSVNENGGSEVHVLDGEVKARPLKEKAFTHLFENEAMVFEQSQTTSRISSLPEKFLRSLPGRSSKNPEYLHWSCDNDRSGQLTCRGTGINGQLYHGTFEALPGGDLPTFGNGQFDEGLYFNGVNSYIKTDFSGIEGNHPRTVMFWSKIPVAPNTNQGYGMLGWGRMSPAAAWQISPNPDRREGPLGRIRVGTHSAYVIGTTDLRDNRWHHIAVVMYGGEHADVSTHILIYIDGKLESTSRKSIAKINTDLHHAASKPLGIGQNLQFRDQLRTGKYAFFKGWLDEIYIFDTALDQQQIHNVMNYNTLHP